MWYQLGTKIGIFLVQRMCARAHFLELSVEKPSNAILFLKQALDLKFFVNFVKLSRIQLKYSKIINVFSPLNVQSVTTPSNHRYGESKMSSIRNMNEYPQEAKITT